MKHIVPLGCVALVGVAVVVSIAASQDAPQPPAPRAVAAGSCFLLREVGGPLRVEHGAICGERVTPASTFKIPHTLIALETGARKSADEIEQWDGRDRGIAVWNRDLSMAEALRASAVWYYQRTALKVGRDAMRRQLIRIHYGNEVIGPELDRFWLDGSLRISAVEQAQFLDRFVRRELPFRAESMDVVDRVLRQAPGTIVRGTPTPVDVTWDPPTTELYSKTGSADLASGNVRWLVGHVMSDSRRYVFVSLVTSPQPLSTEAVTLATSELRDAKLVRDKG